MSSALVLFIWAPALYIQWGLSWARHANIDIDARVIEASSGLTQVVLQDVTLRRAQADDILEIHLDELRLERASWWQPRIKEARLQGMMGKWAHQVSRKAQSQSSSSGKTTQTAWAIPCQRLILQDVSLAYRETAHEGYVEVMIEHWDQPLPQGQLRPLDLLQADIKMQTYLAASMHGDVVTSTLRVSHEDAITRIQWQDIPVAALIAWKEQGSFWGQTVALHLPERAQLLARVYPQAQGMMVQAQTETDVAHLVNLFNLDKKILSFITGREHDSVLRLQLEGMFQQESLLSFEALRDAPAWDEMKKAIQKDLAKGMTQNLMQRQLEFGTGPAGIFTRLLKGAVPHSELLERQSSLDEDAIAIEPEHFRP